MTTSRKSIIFVLLSTVFASVGQVFVKKGADILSFDVMSLITNYALFFGLSLYLVGAALLIVSLRNGELSVIYPIYALNFIWVGLMSPVFFSSDQMTHIKWLGLILVVLGVAFVGFGSRGDKK